MSKRYIYPMYYGNRFDHVHLTRDDAYECEKLNGTVIGIPARADNIPGPLLTLWQAEGVASIAGIRLAWETYQNGYNWRTKIAAVTRRAVDKIRAWVYHRRNS